MIIRHAICHRKLGIKGYGLSEARDTTIRCKTLRNYERMTDVRYDGYVLHEDQRELSPDLAGGFIRLSTFKGGLYFLQSGNQICANVFQLHSCIKGVTILQNCLYGLLCKGPFKYYELKRVGGWGVAVAFLRRFARGTKLVAGADHSFNRTLPACA